MINSHALYRLSYCGLIYKKKARQRPAFTRWFLIILGAEKLNGCVRNGDRCVLFAIATVPDYGIENLELSKLND